MTPNFSRENSVLQINKNNYSPLSSRFVSGETTDANTQTDYSAPLLNRNCMSPESDTNSLDLFYMNFLSTNQDATFL